VLYLLLKVASAVGMGLVLKRADAHSLDRLPLIRTNYAVAAVIGFFAAVALGQTRISNPAALLAAVTGVLFVAGLLVWTRAIRAAGLAMSVVAMRTAVVIPLLAAAIIWHERPSSLELVGSAVALLALSLVLSEVARPKGGDMTGLSDNPDRVPSPPIDTRQSSVGDETTGKTEPDVTTKAQRREEAGTESLAADRQTPSPISNLESRIKNPSALLWLVLLFLADGLVMVPALVFRKELPLNETMPFQTIIFVAAFFVTTLLYYLRRPRLESETLKWGALLGTANLGNYLFLVLALSALPGLVVYPVIAAGEVGLTAVAGVVLWKEKVGVRSWLGIALAVLALVLIQLGKTAGH